MLDKRKARLLYAAGSRWTVELHEGELKHAVTLADEHLAKAVKHMWLAGLSLRQIGSMLDESEHFWQGD